MFADVISGRACQRKDKLAHVYFILMFNARILAIDEIFFSHSLIGNIYFWRQVVLLTKYLFRFSPDLNKNQP